MTLLFSHVCALFDDLEALETKQPPLLPADKADRLRCTLQTWFRQRRRLVDELQTQDTLALLSTFLPERRPDRVYGIQSASLCRILSRSLSLGNAQLVSLQAFKQPGRGDLGSCLQRVLEKTGPPALPSVSVREVDDLLSWLGSQCRFSDPAAHAAVPTSSNSKDERVGSIVKRLQGRDAKWLVRLILKDLAPISIDERLLLRSVHFLLPDVLRFQQDHRAATHALRTTLSAYPSTVDPSAMRILQLSASNALRPQTGVKVGRPHYTKARSIQHALNMVGQGKWVIERKYDGEYCEIHVDLSMSRDLARCVKIFSKNAKDATADRRGIIPTLVQCLKLGRADCRIKKEAIMLGELVVWSDFTKTVLSFEEIRKHVTRSGYFLGTKHDSRPPPHEHLCIVLFDILLLDDRLVLNESVEERRQVLRDVYLKLPGRAKSTEWRILDFGTLHASKRKLMQQFAASNAMACEGLVLKPCGVPYFSLSGGHADSHDPAFIKLKKDYIQGLGDEADFAVVGASYNAQDAARSGVANIRWTHFHLGAIINAEEAQRYGQRPVFKLVGTIGSGPCIPKAVLEIVNQLSHIAADNPSKADLVFSIQPSATNIGTIFRVPLVFEVLGSGYVKPSDCDFLMLRHPRVKKLHQDRTWRDCITFTKLQELAAKSRTTGVESESQENRHELARLERSMKKKFDKQLSKTPSPVKTSKDQASPILQRSSPRVALSEVSNNARSSSEPVGAPASASLTRSRKRRVATSPISLRAPKRQRISGSSVLGENPRLDCNASHFLCGTSSSLLTDIDDTSTGVSARLSTSRRTCIERSCLLSKAVVFFASCVATTPYVTSDLFDIHAATHISSWKHWIRQRGVQDSNAVTCSESQAFPGLKRLVVAEGRRPRALLTLVQDMLDAEFDYCCPIEVWDWRVLEMAQQHVESLDEHRHLLLGSFTWLEIEKRLVWTANEHCSRYPSS